MTDDAAMSMTASKKATELARKIALHYLPRDEVVTHRTISIAAMIDEAVGSLRKLALIEAGDTELILDWTPTEERDNG